MSETLGLSVPYVKIKNRECRVLRIGKMFDEDPRVGIDWIDALAHPSYATTAEGQLFCFFYVVNKPFQRPLSKGEEERVTRVSHRQMGLKSIDWKPVRSCNNTTWRATWTQGERAEVPVLPHKAYERYFSMQNPEAVNTQFSNLFFVKEKEHVPLEDSAVAAALQELPKEPAPKKPKIERAKKQVKRTEDAPARPEPVVERAESGAADIRRAVGEALEDARRKKLWELLCANVEKMERAMLDEEARKKRVLDRLLDCDSLQGAVADGVLTKDDLAVFFSIFNIFFYEPRSVLPEEHFF